MIAQPRQRFVTELLSKRRGLCFLGALFILTLASCKSPIKKEGDAPDAADYVKWMPAAYDMSVEEKLPPLNEKWWEGFESDELNALVEDSLKNNYDLRVAVARVAQTRAGLHPVQ